MSDDHTYQHRHESDLGSWPEMAGAVGALSSLALGPGELSSTLKWEAFTVSSLTAGCRHCQSHGAYALHLQGADVDRIRALWAFETSALFEPSAKVALRFALAASSVPNAVTADHHVELRRHFSHRQITELLTAISLAGFMNRYNDSLATVTDAESVDWASEHLASVGWSVGKHRGAPEEQRDMHPLSRVFGGTGP